MPGHMPDVRVLAFQAGYRCRNAGACCTSNWPIPIEVDRYERARGALASGALRTIAVDVEPFLEPAPDGDEDSAVLLATVHGRCVFHDPAGRCAIHAVLGHDALPLACRQFPRVTVIDPRGVSVTLSHYCPTVASLGNDGNDRERQFIVTNPAAFPPSGEYVGLDARTALPPLLRHGMLMDWDSWWQIERLGVETLLTRGGSPEEALGLIRGAVQLLLSWGPGHGPLDTAAERAFREADPERSPKLSTLVAVALDSIPDGARTAARWDLASANRALPGDLELRRFLAAHAFASWTIHLGGGLMAWVRSIETALAFVHSGADVRQTDLVLRHLIDPPALAARLSEPQ